jgi:hypothetical protein
LAALRVVHFSASRLAGAPIRLVRALQAHTPHEVRLIDRLRWSQFEHDVVFSESREEAMELAEQADIVHLHNYLDYQSGQFAPIDFAALSARGKLFVRQFHSPPLTVARRMGYDMRRVLDSPIPSLVVAQYPERLYPRARVVPNIVPQDDPLYTPSGEPGEGIIFTPGAQDSAWEARWGTKGVRETAAILRGVARRTGCETQIIDNHRPLTEVLDAKRGRLVVIDELVTGSYHLNGLEGLCLAKPAVCFLDDRVQFVLREISGSQANPFVNVRLEDAEEVLTRLVRHPDEAAEIGRDGRAWIDRYWAGRDLVRHYVDVYEQLAEGREIVRQPEFLLDRQAARFTAITLPDLVWSMRRQKSLAARPLHAKLGERAQRTYRRLPWPIRKGLRRLLRRPVFSDEVVAAAMVDRLVQDADIASLTGDGQPRGPTDTGKAAR